MVALQKGNPTHRVGDPQKLSLAKQNIPSDQLERMTVVSLVKRLFTIVAKV